MENEINSVMAHPSGQFFVTFGSTDPVLTSATGDGAKQKALAQWFMNGGKADSWQPSLDELKAKAVIEARANALSVRKRIAGTANTERALSWVLKAVLGGIWQINEQAPNALLRPLADVAAQGFSIETDVTGEDPKDIRDRSVEKVSAFFLALQLVEGMERLATKQIDEVTTFDELTQVIAQLRSLEKQSLAKLSKLGV